MNEKIAILQQWIDESSSIVFFSGAGVSLESGVPDFRSMGNDYFQKYDYPPEAILSRTFFQRKPEEFFQFYRDRILRPLLTAEPNTTHNKLATLEAAGKIRRIITQNMDGLHQEAGSLKVLELYGSVMRNPCPDCERRRTVLEILEHPNVPYCDVDMCGAIFTPEIFLFGDGLDKETMTTAMFDMVNADLLIIAGTSLLEYPAAAFVHLYGRKKMVLINEKEHAMDSRADLFLNASVSEVMSQINVGEKITSS
ncbi:MAG: NAD-dependent protein deacylase [Eubacteriales bacterium]|nr:NAD-dependent protein deacylase [Eubacteriales bacterium]